VPILGDGYPVAAIPASGGVTMKLPFVTMAFLVLLAGSAVAESDLEGGNGVADAIVGPWKLVEWVVTDPSGEKSYPYGESPEGLLIYTADGQMSVQLMNPKTHLSQQDSGDQSDSLEGLVTGYFAYYGTYSIDEKSKTITHKISGCLAPSWIGSDQVRGYDLIGEHRLRLTAELAADDILGPAGAGGSNVLIWERMP
jgi:hypothetical protein